MASRTASTRLQHASQNLVPQCPLSQVQRSQDTLQNDTRPQDPSSQETDAQHIDAPGTAQHDTGSRTHRPEPSRLLLSPRAPAIITARAGELGLGAPLLDSMYRLRAHVFHERLGWDVRVESGREHDWFDLIGPHYLVAHDGAQNALGCCRMLPSTGPNMLRDVFPALLDGRAMPIAESIWEISRFAIDPACAGEGFGFGPLAGALLGRMIHFADRMAGTEVVGVTTVAVERMLLHMGLDVRRLGAPKRVGRVMSLAFSIPVSAANLDVASAYDPPAARAA